MHHMADWLAAHGLSRDQCVRLIPPEAALPEVDDPAFDPKRLWPATALALCQVLPGLGFLFERLVQQARVDLSPDPVRFPRAFTLADAGGGVPFVSCPVQGRLSDVLRLGHEIGHAVQYLAAGTAALAPILRESAALLAELLLCAPEAGLPEGLAALAERRLQEKINRHAIRLRRALDRPDAPYDYGWNYPPAGTIALRAAKDHGLAAEILGGHVDQNDLVARLD